MISFMKISDEYSRILFRFNMQNITVIKTMPGFRYQIKMWFIPISEISNFLQKDSIICEIEENNSKKQKVEQQLQYNEEETRQVFEESIQEKYNKKSQIN